LEFSAYFTTLNHFKNKLHNSLKKNPHPKKGVVTSFKKFTNFKKDNLHYNANNIKTCNEEIIFLNNNISPLIFLKTKQVKRTYLLNIIKTYTSYLYNSLIYNNILIDCKCIILI
jgi:hypothetical protein